MAGSQSFDKAGSQAFNKSGSQAQPLTTSQCMGIKRRWENEQQTSIGAALLSPKLEILSQEAAPVVEKKKNARIEWRDALDV